MSLKILKLITAILITLAVSGSALANTVTDTNTVTKHHFELGAYDADNNGIPDEADTLIEAKFGSNPTQKAAAQKYIRSLMAQKLAIKNLGKSIGHMNIDVETETNSLTGVDADNNGIRDDVDALIKEKYSDTLNHKLAVEQYARITQYQLAVTNYDRATTEKFRIELMDGTHCIFSMFDQVGSMPSEIEYLTLNSRARRAKAWKMARALGGSVTQLPTKNTCYFLN
ncbi:hypothetical protein [Photobacterium toruni]|uniref:hypothetical protein n=1 Tax=Photobacterium toruni TaxID=1935446 RepID=UPI00211094D0|nr:hypothetical protein [Photobacterium toruni]